jgi:hypothetical protein
MLPGVLAGTDIEYATRSFARLLFPHPLADEGLVARARKVLEGLPAGQAVARRVILEEIDELERTARLRARARRI